MHSAANRRIVSLKTKELHMKKLLLPLLASLLYGCGADELETIKNAKIPDQDITWGAATEKLSFCKPESRAWQPIEETDQKKRITTTFHCEMTEAAIAPFNEMQESRIQKETAKHQQWKDEKLQKIAEDNARRRAAFVEYYQRECKKCRTLTDAEIDTLAIEFHNDNMSPNPDIEAMRKSGMFLHADFMTIGGNLIEADTLKNKDTWKPLYHEKITKATFELRITHWINIKDTDLLNEYSSSAKVIYSTDDGNQSSRTFSQPEQFVAKNENPIEAMVKEREVYRLPGQ